jgi:hypothetical protein
VAIALALLSTGAPSGNDPGRLTAHRVRDVEDHVLNHPDGIDPTFSVRLTSIELLKSGVVEEYANCEIEPDAVLSEIRIGLLKVPLEGGWHSHGFLYGIPA